MNIKKTATENLDKILEKFGPEYVLRQCAEECLELGHALMKYIRTMHEELVPEVDGDSVGAAYDHVIEEIADCTLTNSMVANVLEIDINKVNEIIDQKVQRTAERLDRAINKD